LNDEIVIEVGNTLIWITEGETSFVSIRTKGDVKLKEQGRCECGKVSNFFFEGEDVWITVAGGCQTMHCEGHMPEPSWYIEDIVVDWLKKTGAWSEMVGVEC